MARAEERKLIKGVEWAEGPRKRGTVVDGLLGYTDDGHVIHIPTGRGIGPGGDRVIKNDAKFVAWMLDQDPEGWESSRNYAFGDDLTPALKLRLQAVRDSYPGD